MNSNKTWTFSNEWPKAEVTIQRLLKREGVTRIAWQDLFAIIYNINSWVDKAESQIRDAFTNIIDAYVNGAAQRIDLNTNDLELLTLYIAEWAQFYEQCSILPLPFRPPLENKKSDDATRPTIQQIMYNTWKERIFDKTASRILSASMELVDQERRGELFDRKLVVGVRESFVALFDSALDEYEQKFEKTYIERMFAYYKDCGARFLTMNGIRSFMQFADQKLEEEENRANMYLLPSGVIKLLDSAVRVIVCEFEDQILAECPQLIAQEDVKSLSMMYRLIKRTPTGINAVLRCMDEHIKTEGIRDMREHAETISTDAEKYVSRLLHMFEKFTKLINEGFYADARVLTARDQAFREVVNNSSFFRLDLQPRKGPKTAESKCPELLAQFCDILLRKTALSKRLTTEEIDERLSNVMLVLKYVNNKDVFMRYHKAHLSRRLLLEMSADQDKEEIVISRLRESGMPAEQVNKLFRMMGDIELNKDLNVDFKKYLWENSCRQGGEISEMLTIKILNSGAWGRHSGNNDAIRISMPRVLDEYLPYVEEYYKKKYSGRKLQWVHYWSNGTIAYTSDVGRYEIDLTTFQLSVLFCWQDRPDDELSFESLKLATELPDSELTRTLLSMCLIPKARSTPLIECTSEDLTSSRDSVFTDSSTFKLNTKFYVIKGGRMQTRGKLSIIGRLQMALDSAAPAEHEDIVTLRQFRVQEAIVKVMKVRKTMNAWQLHTELVDQLKHMFLPSRQLIKEQVEWLLENHFLERSPQDINTLIYTA